MTADEIFDLRMHPKLMLSREAFARRLGVTSQTIYRWENEITKPSPICAVKLQRLKDEVDYQ